MEDIIDHAAGIFEIVVKARLVTKLDEPLILSTIIKHPYIAEIDKKLKSYSKRATKTSKSLELHPS